ncbi:MAG TPA: hypothetical protein VIV60_03760, partial [Polyangiaceae bacterium]
MNSFRFGWRSISGGFLMGACVLGCGDDPQPRGPVMRGDQGDAAGATGLTDAAGAAGGPSAEASSAGGGVAGAMGSMSGNSGNTTAPSINAYQACSNAVATGQAPVISNFDAADLRVLPNEGRAGLWFSYNDGTNGKFTENLEAGALHITSNAWTDWGAGFGVSIGPWLSNGERCYYNADRYAGIRFRAKGRGRVRTNVTTRENVPVAEGGACQRAGDDCYNYPGGYARLTNDWQVFEFPFCAMRPQPLWGGAVAPIKPSELIAIQFALSKEG